MRFFICSIIAAGGRAARTAAAFRLEWVDVRILLDDYEVDPLADLAEETIKKAAVIEMAPAIFIERRLEVSA